MASNYHIIASNDTMSAIAARYNIDDWKKIWDLPKNVTIRKYWPLGSSTTERQLPIGYTLFIPGKNYLAGSIVEQQEKFVFVNRQELVGDLYFRVQYFTKLDIFGWWPEHFNYAWEKGLPYNFFGQKGGETELTVFSNENSKWMNHTKIGYNYAKHEYITTLLQSNQRYSGNAKKDIIYDLHSFGIVEGNPQKTTKMDSGYVYIFSRTRSDADFELKKTYYVFDGTCQPIKVTSSNDSHQVSAGAAMDHMIIEDFFPNDQEEDQQHKETFVYTSDIPLSKRTLFEGNFALTKRAHIVGSELNDRNWMLNDPYRKPKDGSDIHDIVISTSGYIPPVDSKVRNMLPTRIAGKQGFTLVTTHPATEAYKRADDFRDKLDDFLAWRENKERHNKAFIWGVLNTLLKNKAVSFASGLGMFGDVNEDNYKEFERNDKEEAKSKFLNAKYAALHLIAWLKDERFKQLVRDYSDRFPDSIEDTEKDYQEQLLKILNHSLDGLNMIDVGNRYLSEIIDDVNSFYHMLMQHKDKNEVLNGIHKKLAQIPSAPNSETLNAFRKTTGGVMAFIEHFVPFLAKKIGPETLLKSVETTVNANFRIQGKITISSYELKDGSYGYTKLEKAPDGPGAVWTKFDATIQQYDIHENKWYNNTDKWGGNVAKTLEVINAAVAVYTLVKNEEEGKLGDNVVAALGAFADLQVEFAETWSNISKMPWHLSGKFSLFKKLGSGLTQIARVAPLACLISGIVDFYSGVKGAIENFHEGNYTIAFGHSLIAASGVFAIAAGIFWINAAGGAVVAAGVTVETPPLALGCLIGSVICATIGSLIITFGDTPIENWAESCYFGKDPKKNLESQIDDLMHLLCRFRLDGPNWESVPANMYQKGVITQYCLTLHPGCLITKSSIIELTALSITGQERSATNPRAYYTGIFPDYFTDQAIPPKEMDLSQGTYTSDDFSWVVKLSNNGLIEQVAMFFNFKAIINQFKGRVTLKVRNSTLQKNLEERVKSDRHKNLQHSERF